MPLLFKPPKAGFSIICSLTHSTWNTMPMVCHSSSHWPVGGLHLSLLNPAFSEFKMVALNHLWWMYLRYGTRAMIHIMALSPVSWLLTIYHQHTTG